MPDTSTVVIDTPDFETIADGPPRDEAIEALASLLLELAEQEASQ